MENTKTIEVTLVRHGITTSNEAHLIVGWQDVELSTAGRKQLEEYRDTIHYPEVQRFYSSDLKRAKDTFEILFSPRYSIYRTLSGFREVYFGTHEGLTPEENKKSGFYQHWLNAEKVNDEESYEEFRQRVMEALHDVVQESIHDGLEKIGIVLHEGSIKAILMSLEKRDFKYYQSFYFGNGLGLTLKLEVTENDYKLVDKKLIQKEESINVVLVRHGISVANENRIFAGITDYDLGESGVKQLEEYRDMIAYPQPDRFYCSPLLRARRTFDILYGDKHQVYRYLDNFKENNYGDYENTPTGPLAKKYFENWTQGILLSNEEPRDVFRKRVMDGLKLAYNQTKQDNYHSFGIVAHAGVIKTLLLDIRKQPYNEWNTIFVENGKGYVLNIEYINDEPHLFSMQMI